MNHACIAIAALALMSACASDMDAGSSAGYPTLGETGGGVASIGDDDDGASGSTAAADPDDDDDTGSDDALKLDVAAADGGSGCSEDDVCCLMPGEIPPHALLDAFLAAYPPANMPKTLPEIEAWAPMADGETIAWSDANSGGEIIDPVNGGVTDAHVLEGRALSRAQAETTIPADAVVLDVREEPVLIDNPGGNPECVGSSGATGNAGIGWAWGSILFRTADLAIHEVVYLYIGFCVETIDHESFWTSETSLQICAPPG